MQINSCNNYIKNQIDKLNQDNLYREIKNSVRENNNIILRDGKKYISFTCNDYLGLSNCDKLKQAAISAINEYGVGAGASRLLSGSNILYDELEQLLSDYKGTEKSLVFGSGYLTNIGVISALVDNKDMIIMDKLSHACQIDGSLLSNAKLYRYSHNNIAKCEDLLKKHRKSHQKCLIITETIFSMDGDKAPIADLLYLAKKYDALLLSDAAHGFGFCDIISDDYHLQMGTFSKALAGYGGYICTNNLIYEYLVNKSRSLIYSTALPPAILASNIVALKIAKSDKNLAIKALDNAKLFTNLMNLPEAVSPIVIMKFDDIKYLSKINDKLKEFGFLVGFIRPPTAQTPRLRFTFNANHKISDIENLTNKIKEII